jgi:3-oxoadipate enol-lactonase
LAREKKSIVSRVINQRDGLRKRNGQSKMPFVKIDKAVQHYVAEGGKEKPALVFSNSLGSDLRIWDSVASRLAGHFQTIRYDKRGHGLSDSTEPPYTIDDLARDLVGLLDALEIRQAVVCGISVGGLIAQCLALNHPQRVRALVLCDTGARIGSTESWDQRIATVQTGGLQPLEAPSMERWFTQPFRERCPADVRGYSNMLLRTTVAGYLGTCCALRDADFTPDAARIKQPTLVLCGEQDIATPPELGQSLARLIPHARFSLIQKAAHLPCIEQSEAVADKMMEFFREVQIG